MNLFGGRITKPLCILVMALLLVPMSVLTVTAEHDLDCAECATDGVSAPGHAAQDGGCDGCGHSDGAPCSEDCPRDCVQPCCAGFILHEAAVTAIDTLRVLHQVDPGRRIACGPDCSDIFVPPERALSS